MMPKISSTQKVYARVPVDNAVAMGPVELLTSGSTFDGFALLQDGTAYV